MTDKKAKERSIERMNKRISTSKKNKSSRGEPIVSASTLNIGKLSRGKDGKLWVVIEEKKDDQIEVKKWVQF